MRTEVVLYPSCNRMPWFVPSQSMLSSLHKKIINIYNTKQIYTKICFIINSTYLFSTVILIFIYVNLVELKVDYLALNKIKITLFANMG